MNENESNEPEADEAGADEGCANCGNPDCKGAQMNPLIRAMNDQVRKEVDKPIRLVQEDGETFVHVGDLLEFLNTMHGIQTAAFALQGASDQPFPQGILFGLQTALNHVQGKVSAHAKIYNEINIPDSLEGVLGLPSVTDEPEEGQAAA